MTLNEAINVAEKAFAKRLEKGCISGYWDAKNQKPLAENKFGHTDFFAKGIVQEIYETWDDEQSSLDNLENLINVIGRATIDLAAVTIALQDELNKRMK